MWEYKILVIGTFSGNHLIRLIKNLKKCNPNILIDAVTYGQPMLIPEETNGIINKIYWFNPKTINIPFLRPFNYIFQLYALLRSVAKNNHYDILNIHFPSYEYSFLVKQMNRLADNIVLTPWGSDVYRVGNFKTSLLRKLYRKADYVCNPNTRFGKDVRRIFNLRKEQIVNLGMGSETIDYIIENKDILSVSESRKRLGLEGDYFITCGYNAHPAQNHGAIIDEVRKFQNKFSGRISLIFPMTYPKNQEYINKIKIHAKRKGLNAYFFTEYLDLPTLFLLRQCTDMFIHVQNTDANSASVQEYLLLEKKVLNGEWLRYDNMEIDGEIPYTLVKDLTEISEAIETAYYQSFELTSDLYEYLESSGWKNLIKKWNSFFVKISR